MKAERKHQRQPTRSIMKINQDGPVTCRHCDHEWDREPAYEIDCPTCGAKAGEICTMSGTPVLLNSQTQRNSGHNMGTFTPLAGICRARDQAAIDQGLLEPCWNGVFPPQSYLDRVASGEYPA